MKKMWRLGPRKQGGTDSFTASQMDVAHRNYRRRRRVDRGVAGRRALARQVACCSVRAVRLKARFSADPLDY